MFLPSFLELLLFILDYVSASLYVYRTTTATAATTPTTTATSTPAVIAAIMPTAFAAAAPTASTAFSAAAAALGKLRRYQCGRRMSTIFYDHCSVVLVFGLLFRHSCCSGEGTALQVWEKDKYHIL